MQIQLGRFTCRTQDKQRRRQVTSILWAWQGPHLVAQSCSSVAHFPGLAGPAGWPAKPTRTVCPASFVWLSAVTAVIMLAMCRCVNGARLVRNRCSMA